MFSRRYFSLLGAFLRPSRVRLLGDPALRSKLPPLDRAALKDHHVQSAFDQLTACLASEQGLGLAAPQLALPYRAFAMRLRPLESEDATIVRLQPWMTNGKRSAKHSS
jgi:peptide deformylase